MGDTVGIVGFGSYIPKYRIKVETIAKEWGDDANSIVNGIQVYEKTVPGLDEDTITISVEAAKNAFKRAAFVEPARIGAVYIGSESHPYAVKPSGTVVAEALGIVPDVHIADFEFACKGGTEAMFVAMMEIRARIFDYTLAIGADTSQGAPNDALEYTAAAGGSAFIMGRENLIAELVDTYSYATDTPDFWRRDHQPYPEHAGRFTGQPAYFKHLLTSAKNIMEKNNLKPDDFRFVVFHMPNARFPRTAARKLGFKKEQIEPGLIVPYTGNFYSGASPTGLSAVLDVAEPGDLILITSFGSGAGSDSFIFKVTERIKEVQDKAKKVWDQIRDNPIYLDYGKYVRYRKKILMNE